MPRELAQIHSRSLASARDAQSRFNEPQNRIEAERLIERSSIELFEIALAHGVTVKRMRDLLTTSVIRNLHRQGATRQQIMAASGFCLKTINRILTLDTSADDADLVAGFAADWAADPAFPGSLSLDNGAVPSFQSLCDRYGREFTPTSLLEALQARGLVNVDDGMVRLTAEQSTGGARGGGNKGGLR